MSETKRKVPKLRFPGFTEDWEQRKLGEILKVNSGKDYKHLENGDIPVYGTGGYMISVNEALSEVDAIGIGRKGTIDKPQYLKAPFWTVDTLFYLVPLEKYSCSLLYHLSNLIPWKKFDESTGVPSLSKSIIDGIQVNIPKDKKEQDTISMLFDRINNLITLHQRKLENLKLKKKALLQKLFPKNGEQFPELRFPGFTDAWEQCKLGEIATVTGGGTPSTNISEYWNGDIDWYSPVEIGENRYVSGSIRKITKLGLEKSSAKILPVGTVLFTSRAGIGNTAILQVEGCTNQGFQSITPNLNDLDTYFLYTMTPKLKRYGEITGAGSTFVEVSGKQMEQMNLMVPSLEEQKRVGELFKTMDDAITLHQRKLEHLQLQKKALLQQMFV